MNYEQFYTKGYQIFPNVLSSEKVSDYKKAVIRVCKNQANSFGLDKIQLIEEENIARSPFLYNPIFQELFYNDFTMKIVEDILGQYAILSLQNAIIVPPEQEHHQGFYHRDIIYQEFVSSRPMAINLYYCLDDYSVANGGTTFIPYSHKKDKIVSFEKEETPVVKAGSVILFDSMIYHKAGVNATKKSRCGINNMYSLPFIKQQINYPFCLKKPTKDSRLNRLLGFESREYLDVGDFRQHRLNRKLNE
jgi:ectoine hydroxylase-related dioxygenase (phytanoyl-CoA dioxygenase family)